MRCRSLIGVIVATFAAAATLAVPSDGRVAAASRSAPAPRYVEPGAPGSRYGARHERVDRGARSRPDRAGPAPTVAVGNNPLGFAIDHRTGSVYVATTTGAAMFDLSTCSARNHSGCSGAPTVINTGSGGIEMLLDESTNTVYLANAGDNMVTAIDTATCNVHVTAGCGSPHPTKAAGLFPSHLALDEHVHTLYASDEGDDSTGLTVAMIDTATCNGHTTVGCSGEALTAPAGIGPDGLVIDPATNTLFVSDGGATTVSIINTSTCNATNSAGCLPTAPTIQLAAFPISGAFDPATRTLMVPIDDFDGGGDTAGSLAIIDTRTCNATVVTGCGTPPVTVPAGSGPINVAFNPLTRRAYVVNEEDSDVSVIDMTRCNAVRTDGCHQRALTMAIGFDGGADIVDVTTNTIYASSQDEGTVTVLDGRACNSSNTSGCRHPAPTTVVGIGAQAGVLDQHTGTVYVSNQLANTISVVDPNACAANRLLGCRQTWPTIAVGENPKQLANDEAHDTLYVGDYTGNAVSVIDTSTCNTHVTTGCGQTPPSIPVSGGAYDVVRDPVTATLYVANVDSDTLTLINTDTCNAHVTSGCAQTPVGVHIGNLPAGLLIDPLTRTLYVSIRGDSNVTVVDMATCNITDTTGCAGAHPAIPINAPPRFLAVDDSTRTLYVSTRNTSTVALVDTGTCNAQVSSGCAQAPPVVNVGYLPYGVTLDAVNHQLFVGNVGDSTVTAFDSRTCNAHTTTGCNRPMRTIEAGGWPLHMTVDNRNGTLYISDNVDAQVSIVNLVARR